MSEPIVCKPTPWFLLRAIAVMVMCAVFAVMFYRDGSIGYRRQNATYYLYHTFDKAGREFAEMNAAGKGEAEWKRFASEQKVDFPKDASVLPPEAGHGMPWPAVLGDYERMKTTSWNLLWNEFSGQWPHWKMSNKPPEHDFPAHKIQEQWTVLYVCCGLFIVAAFFFVRTLLRRVELRDGVLRSAEGKRVAVADIKRLDLRKWEDKGLAFVTYQGAGGSGSVRIDGLTYGGFKAADGAPAERLVQALRSGMHGEIIEYAKVEESPAQAATATADEDS